MALRKRVCGDGETEKRLEGLAGADLKLICESICELRYTDLFPEDSLH